MPAKNYYHILQVPPQASYEQIKKAYRSLAKKCHPDVAEKPTQQFLLINEAYTVLSNPDAREAYHYRYFFEKVPVQPPANTNTILQDAEKLVAYINSSHQHFINYDKIEIELKTQLIELHFQLLLANKTQPSVLLNVCQLWLQAIQVLPFQLGESFYHLLQSKLTNHPSLVILITKQKQQHLYKYYIQKTTIPAVIILAILLCWAFVKLMP